MHLLELIPPVHFVALEENSIKFMISIVILTIMSIRETVSLSPLLLAQCEEFMCQMYGKHELQSLHEARYKLFCDKGCSSEQFSPTANELQLHLMRACYQATI